MKKILNKIWKWFVSYWCNLTKSGLFVAVIFVAFSMTPSLLPRSPLFQGLLSGVVFAFGYGIGCFLLFLWQYLELPKLKGRALKRTHIIFFIIGMVILVCALGNWTDGQNSILQVMNQELVAPHQSLFLVISLIFSVAVILIALGRLILRWFRFVIKKMHKFVPRHVSNFIGFVLALIIFIGLVNGVLVRSAIDLLDSVAATANNLIEDGKQIPTDPLKTGSGESLVEWNTLGREGRNFIADGPSAQEISDFSGTTALEPLRVYVGLQSRETLEERAALALEELKRINAFDRSTLIISTPTGTGWMDPYAVNTIEYILGGDTVNVTSQYSYLSSQATLVFYPKKASMEAEALFSVIYDYWKTLPHDSRPKVYLWGLSLGSFGSERSAKLHDIMYDPIDGALWTGPPFVNKLHGDIVDNRNPESPQWLPTYEDGSLIQFVSNNVDKSEDVDAPWGDMRILYLQNGSDPMAFFSEDLFYKNPDWLTGERAPDVSPLLVWRPIVTFFQVAFDLIVSVSAAPLGYGHNYSPVDYIDSWIMLMDPDNWTDDMTVRLKELFLE